MMKKNIFSLLFAVFTAMLCAQEDYNDWLTIRSTALETWEIIPYEDNGSMVSLKPRGDLAADPAKRVMVLFPKKSSAYDTALDTILRVFPDKDLSVLITCIFYGNREDRGKSALAFAEANQYDLIFSMGSDSTSLVHNSYRNGKIPVVTVCSKDPVLRGQMPDYEAGSGTNIAYTSLDMNTKLQLEYLLKLKRDLKHIIILYAAVNTSVINTQVEPLKRDSSAFGITCYDLVVQDQKKAKEELAEKMTAMITNLKAKDPTLSRTIFWITGTTEIFGEIATIVAAADTVPVLSVVPDVVMAGDNSAVLSLGISFESNAHRAALYAVSILTGEAKAGDLPVGVVSPPDMAINFRKAKQIGMTVPFGFFESATVIYDNDGNQVRP